MTAITSFDALPLVLHVKDIAEILSISQIPHMRWFAPAKSAVSAQDVLTVSRKTRRSNI